MSPRRRPMISSVSVDNACVKHVNHTSSDIFTPVRDILCLVFQFIEDFFFLFFSKNNFWGFSLFVVCGRTEEEEGAALVLLAEVWILGREQDFARGWYSTVSFRLLTCNWSFLSSWFLTDDWLFVTAKTRFLFYSWG